MDRLQEIDSAIGKLKDFKKDPSYKDLDYGIEQDMDFLDSIRTVSGYLTWLLKKANKLDRDRLAELTDFSVEEWDRKMHGPLMEVQRNKNIGLGKPLVDSICAFVKKNKKGMVLASLGAGGMEADRQVIQSLKGSKHDQQVIIVGIDRSSHAHTIAYENLTFFDKDIKIYRFDRLSQNDLDEIRKNEKGIAVVLCKNDIFKLKDQFPLHYFDLTYHSLFKHHFIKRDQERLDEVMSGISKQSLEYDGYKSWIALIPQSITGWKYPLFLSDTVFSMLRYSTKKQIKSLSGKISFFTKTGHYLREIEK